MVRVPLYLPRNSVLEVHYHLRALCWQACLIWAAAAAAAAAVAAGDDGVAISDVAQSVQAPECVQPRARVHACLLIETHIVWNK